jgi:predicted site-specific integrase-resolvase
MVDEFLTLADAGRRLGVHPATIGRRVNQGEIPAFIGADRRKRFVRKEDVDRIGTLRPLTHQESGHSPRTAA